MKRLILLSVIVLAVIQGVTNAGASVIGAHNLKTIEATE
jgi:hypothetical protein